MTREFHGGNDANQSTDEVLVRYAGLVYRTALGVVGNPADAEDICQEALIAISRGLAGYRGEARLSTWIYRITVRIAVRWVARERSRNIDPGFTPERLPATTGSEPSLELLEAFRRLPVDSRNVLILVTVEGFSHAEAARALGIPEGTVASRLHTARRRLRVLLGDPPTREDGAAENRDAPSRLVPGGAGRDSRARRDRPLSTDR